MAENSNLFKAIFGYILKIIVLIQAPLFSQTLLVDFGSNAADNQFQLTGWNNLIKSPFVNYTATGPKGLVPNSGVRDLDDYQGVRGIERTFRVGERIVVVWYNNSDNSYFISARISFTDSTNPDPDGSGGRWYTMRSFSDYRNTYSEILPHSSSKTVFNITNEGVHKTDSTYSLVNINLNIEWNDTIPKPFIICDKIELYNDADIHQPTAPANLSAQALSDSKIKLNWSVASDNDEVVEYLIYCNNKVEGYSRTNSFTTVLLEPNTQYSFTVTAFDKAGNESIHSIPVIASTLAYKGTFQLINPMQIKYIGSFKLPETFSYGADALTYRSDGDGGVNGSGASDGFPGSLFVSDLNIPDRGLVAEVSIPSPKKSVINNLDELNEVTIIQQPVNIRPANVNNRSYVDLWRNGLAYIDSEKRLYSSWSIYYTVTGEKNPAISFCEANNLSSSTKYGAWYLGSPSSNPNDAMAYDYLFTIPKVWADQNTSGKSLISGRSREGGLSGLGPTFYAANLISNNSPPAPGSVLEMTTLLEYRSVEGTDNYNFPNSFVGYNHADWWRDACWISYNNQAAFIVMGKKGLGNNWYGYHGEEMRNEWINADLPYPDFFETDPDGKGWRSNNFSTMMIFYNPNDLASVVKGLLKPYEPEPYAVLRLDSSVFWGNNREIASACYDDQNKILYVSEFNADSNGRIIIHTFRIESPPTTVDERSNIPSVYSLMQNYPNPFNPETTIEYTIPNIETTYQSVFTTLKIYDILGREVETLVNELKGPGNYKVIWKPKVLASGIYFYRINAGEFSTNRKMIYLK